MIGAAPTSAGGTGAGSLRRRLLLAAGVFLGVALVTAGLGIGFILHRFVRGQIDGRLDDRIRALVAEAGEAGRGGPARDGPPFDRPRSGWYWQVRDGDGVLRSASLEGRDLPLPDAPGARVGTGRPEPADGTGPWGEGLVLRVLTVPRGAGPPTVVAASAPSAALRGPVIEALRTLAVCLGVIGLFLFAGVVLQIRLGLAPLRRLRDGLADVRAGRRDRLSGPQPAEIAPLVEEINALLDQNAAGLAHARAHLANLAHGLKTPLATLSMALAERGDPDGALSGLVEGMDRRVRHHLRRARAAAIGGPVRARLALEPRIADLRTALLRLHADRGPEIAVDVPADLAVACDGQDLDEMLGNLVENACQWCRARVRVRAEAGGRAEVVVWIEDDGPGLDAAAMRAVLRRGRRLDESLPGHGLGLPIAVELAELYGGSLRLDRSDLGGLRVRLALPA